ncbi:MAG TPA: substrate-binding domain-containing protein [Treponema sp.]|nr:substrate-binding domain-containing protein [Treponema sp.]
MAREKNGLRKGVIFVFFAITAVVLACFFVLVSLVDFKVPEENLSLPSDSIGIIVGFSQIGAESSWRKHNTLSIREAAQEKGIQLLFENAEQKQENQIKAIRSFIAYQVDVIAFVPIVAEGWDNVLRESAEAGIPILITDRKIKTDDESLFAGFIGTDSLEEGRNAGRFIIRKFSQEYTPPRYRNRSLRIFELSGTEGASVTSGRAQGFRDVLNKDNRFSIVYSESGDFLRSKGYEIAQNILDNYDTIDVVFSHNDSMTLGFIDAMKERGMSPGVDIVIVSIDAEQAAIDALRAGEINCVVECNPKTGPAIMNLAIQLAEGKAIPRLLHVEERVFSEDDTDLETVAPRGY